MKRVMALILALVFCLSIVACGGSSTAPVAEEDSSDAAVAEEGSSSDSAAVDNSDIDIVLVVPNTLGDKAFSDMVWSGITMAKETYGLGTIKCIELQGDTSTPIPTLTELSELGEWDIIVTGTYSLKEAIVTVAAEFPEQKFIVYDTELDYSDGAFQNAVSYAAMQNEGSFLAGALAALMTETDTVGFVGGKETTSVSDFLVGYIEGAQYINPDITVYSSFIGSFTDTSTAKELTLSQYGQNADIVFAVCSGAGLGVYEAAKEKGLWAFGVDSDQALILEDTDPDTAKQIMTSVVKHLDVILADAIGDYIDGSLTFGQHFNVNLAAGGIGLADNEYYQAAVPEDVRVQVDEISEKIVSGEIVVGTAIGMDADTYQALKDSALNK